jgi:hypothetical protein
MKIENMQLRRKCDRLRPIRDISGEWVLFEETITVRSTRKCQRTGGAREEWAERSNYNQVSKPSEEKIK